LRAFIAILRNQSFSPTHTHAHAHARIIYVYVYEKLFRHQLSASILYRLVSVSMYGLFRVLQLRLRQWQIIRGIKIDREIIRIHQWLSTYFCSRQSIIRKKFSRHTQDRPEGGGLGGDVSPPPNKNTGRQSDLFHYSLEQRFPIHGLPLAVTIMVVLAVN
jgi:hypothetical protein